jgi:hypothetical protein
MDYYETAMDRWRERVRARGHDPDAVLEAIRKIDPI